MALSDGLVGYWSAWQGSSGYRLLDRARSNQGTLTNMDAGTDWVGATVRGRSGYALDFDGTDDFVDPANVTGVGFGNFTFAAWVRTSVVARRYMIASNLTDVASEGHWLAFETSNRLYSYFGSELFATATGITLADNNWHLVGVTRLGTTGTLFADGRQIGSSGAIGGFDAGKGNFRIGARGDSLIQNWQGQMAEIAIWNRAATASDFLELFRLGPGWYQPYRKRAYGYAATVAGFKAYWARRQSQLIGGGV